MIFIDTSAFLARYLTKDQYYEIAIKFWEELASREERCFTSNFVLDETFTLLARRAGYTFASQRAHIFYASKALTILRPTHEHELKALELFDKFADQHISFTDCISFVLMKAQKITRVFSFDDHFTRAGFHQNP